MKIGVLAFASALLIIPVEGQIKRTERQSLLNSDPSVVYLENTLSKPLKLQVVEQFPVFSDKDGKNRVGFLKANQTVEVEAITDKVYRVRGQGLRDGIVGWISPAAFSSKDPDFVKNLKDLYERQIAVAELIAAKKVAMGMTMEEVASSLGKPTITKIRTTADGDSGKWSFIEYEEIKHYTTRRDPRTGMVYRTLAGVTQNEKSKTIVEFENSVVTAIEESENHSGSGTTRLVVPPLIWRW